MADDKKKKGRGKVFAGPRDHIRWQTDKQRDRIEEARELLNKESMEFDGTETTFNKFVVDATVEKAKKILKKNK